MVDIYSAELEVSFGKQRLIFIGEPCEEMGYGLFSDSNGQYRRVDNSFLSGLIEDIKINMPRNSLPKTVDDEIVQPVVDEMERLENDESSSKGLTKEVRLLLSKIGLN